MSVVWETFITDYIDSSHYQVFMFVNWFVGFESRVASISLYFSTKAEVLLAGKFHFRFHVNNPSLSLAAIF